MWSGAAEVCPHHHVRFLSFSNVAVGLKTLEVGETISTYVMIFDVNTGEIILPDQWIDDRKYEGIEFLEYN